MANYLTTYTGIHINPLAPQEADFIIEDIAHALSYNCRGNGQTKHFYSVGQHCINCMKEAAERGYDVRIQLGCLLHDAAEAYLSDLIRPIKQYMNGYQEIENNFLTIIFQKFGLSDFSEEEWKMVKEIDDALLVYDLVELLGEKKPEDGYHFVRTPDIEFVPFENVEREYIECFQILQTKLSGN